MPKQLELDLTQSNERDVDKYLQAVKLNSMRHFLGDKHPKVLEERNKAYTQ